MPNVNGQLEGIVSKNDICEKVSQKDGTTFWAGELLVDVDQGYQTRSGWVVRRVLVPVNFYTKDANLAAIMTGLAQGSLISLEYSASGRVWDKGGEIKYFPQIRLEKVLDTTAAEPVIPF